MKLLFLDTETTGLDPLKNGVFQISALIDIDGEQKTGFNLKCSPFKGDIVSKKALEVTGVKVEDLRLYPDARDIYDNLIKIFDSHVDRYEKSDKFYMVGQNVKFDYDFMNQWFKKNGNDYFYGYVNYYLIDLIAVATLFKVAGKLDIERMNLESLANHFGIQLNAHDAMSDIMATREIFYKFVEQVKGGEER